MASQATMPQTIYAPHTLQCLGKDAKWRLERPRIAQDILHYKPPKGNVNLYNLTIVLNIPYKQSINYWKCTSPWCFHHKFSNWEDESSTIVSQLFEERSCCPSPFDNYGEQQTWQINGRFRIHRQNTSNKQGALNVCRMIK